MEQAVTVLFVEDKRRDATVGTIGVEGGGEGGSSRGPPRLPRCDLSTDGSLASDAVKLDNQKSLFCHSMRTNYSLQETLCNLFHAARNERDTHLLNTLSIRM